MHKMGQAEFNQLSNDEIKTMFFWNKYFNVLRIDPGKKIWNATIWKDIRTGKDTNI